LGKPMQRADVAVWQDPEWATRQRSESPVRELPGL